MMAFIRIHKTFLTQSSVVTKVKDVLSHVNFFIYRETLLAKGILFK